MTPQPSEQPRTAAGRALVDMPLHTAGIGSDRDDARLLAAVLAIEAQAAAPDPDHEHDWQTFTGPHINGSATVCSICGLLAAAPDPVASPPEAVRLLRALADELEPAPGERCGEYPELCTACQLMTEARRFLEGAVASPAPLDVERLAQAYHMSQLCVHGVGSGQPMQTPGYLKPDREAAQLIAVEYARLEGQPVAEEPA